MAMVERVADSDVGVLLRGESGVGKELIARELHRRSQRRARPYVKVNCAALPADLLESELFGHERGAFTGAGATRVGRFEFAQHGTVMLDEIGEMPPALQAKLLHVLQDRSFTRLGSNRVIDVDVRIISATNRDLEAMMRAGTFREDLYYRLQVIELRIPPLRERQEEIAPLVEFFLSKYARVYRRPAIRPSPGLLQALRQYSWPGNIRELENMMKRLVVLQEEQLVLSELDRLRASSEPRPHTEPVTAPPVLPLPAPPPAVMVESASAAEHTVDAAGRRPRSDRPPRRGQGRRAQGRTAGDRRSAGDLPVEPPEGGRVPRRELQDAAHEDEGVRDLGGEPGLVMPSTPLAPRLRRPLP
jgi:two-component system response regulator AtoC